MTDRNKVIKGLECCVNYSTEVDWTDYCSARGCPYADREATCITDLQRDALALLLEREAVKPREQEETRTWIVCGNCSQHLISKWLWCPYCGRQVKWDE